MKTSLPDNFSRIRRSWSAPAWLALGLSLVAPVATAGEQGKLTEELWTGIGGDAVSSLISDPAFPGSPTSVGKIEGVEPASDIGDSYGRRLRGWITLPRRETTPFGSPGMTIASFGCPRTPPRHPNR